MNIVKLGGFNEVYMKFQFWGNGLYISNFKHARLLYFAKFLPVLVVDTNYQYGQDE